MLSISNAEINKQVNKSCMHNLQYLPLNLIFYFDIKKSHLHFVFINVILLIFLSHQRIINFKKKLVSIKLSTSSLLFLLKLVLL